MADEGGRRSPRLLPFARLIERLRQGDASAEEELFRRYREFIKELAAPRMSRALRRHADPSDIAQSVLRVFAECVRRKEFSGDPAIRAYLRTVAEHKIARLPRRARGPRGRPLESLGETADRMIDRGGQTPDELAARFERVDLMKRALDALPEEPRRLIRLRDFERLTFPAIAEELRLPDAGRARYLYRRARALLEQALLALLKRGQGGAGTDV